MNLKRISNKLRSKGLLWYFWSHFSATRLVHLALRLVECWQWRCALTFTECLEGLNRFVKEDLSARENMSFLLWNKRKDDCNAFLREESKFEELSGVVEIEEKAWRIEAAVFMEEGVESHNYRDHKKLWLEKLYQKTFPTAFCWSCFACRQGWTLLSWWLSTPCYGLHSYIWKGEIWGWEVDYHRSGRKEGGG